MLSVEEMDVQLLDPPPENESYFIVSCVFQKKIEFREIPSSISSALRITIEDLLKKGNNDSLYNLFKKLKNS